MNDILTRLQNGESIDSIASEFTKQLNEAAAAYEAEQNAKASAIAVASRKEDLIRSMITPFVTYIEEFHPDFEVEGFHIEDLANPSSEDCASIAELIDSYIDLMNSPFLKMFTTTPVKKTAHKIEKTPNGVKITGKAPLTTEELDKIFTDFFKVNKI